MLLINNVEDMTKYGFVDKMMQRLQGSTEEDKVYLEHYYDWECKLIDHEEVAKLYLKTSFFKKQMNVI